MSYLDTRDMLDTIKGIYRRSFDFSGRSRRTDVIVFMFVPPLIAMAVFLPLHLLFSVHIPQPLDRLMQALLAVPMVALFVRRLHDQDRSGWWILLMPPTIIYSALRHWELTNNPRFYYTGWPPLFWANGILVVLIMVLYLWPGTDGANGYGTDPRDGGPGDAETGSA